LNAIPYHGLSCWFFHSFHYAAPMTNDAANAREHALKGRLFLAGDAVHITPPAGAKGLNLAVADVRVMANALIELYRTGNKDRLNSYSERCLDRVWKTVRFSTMLTGLHKFPDHSAFERSLQLTELEYILGSRAARTVIAEQYVGPPLNLP
jgi:p-hydroxybenzoate 3-monooxygenase